jgi:2,3-diaminopropionate biosynthesis protein SbnA
LSKPVALSRHQGRQADLKELQVMSIVQSPLELMFGNVFMKITGIVPEAQVPIFVKVEGLNMAGSIKLKPAIHMIEQLERNGILRPDSEIVESSSGNLGVALSLVCSLKGYKFTCVSDPNITPQNHRLIKAYGGSVVIVDQRDANGGFLNTRIDLINRWIDENPKLIWINQYANKANKGAHYRWTGPEILRNFPNIDFLFVGAGTTGTLMGCAEFMRQHSPRTQIIAVDSEGSVTFGFPSGKRHIPGLGTSRRPELVDPSIVDDILLVPEVETVEMCHKLLRTQGWLVGGSTGTVLAGVRRFAHKIRPGQTVVAISPERCPNVRAMEYSDTFHQPSIRHQEKTSAQLEEIL